MGLGEEEAWGPEPAVSRRPLLCVPSCPQPVFLQRGAFRAIIFVLPLASVSSSALALTTTPLADPHTPWGLSVCPYLPKRGGVQDTRMTLAFTGVAGAEWRPARAEQIGRQGESSVVS